MSIFVVELNYGMGLMEARTLASARKRARIENGTRNLRGVRAATADDIAHVRAMGGYVPEESEPRRPKRRGYVRNTK